MLNNEMDKESDHSDKVNRSGEGSEYKLPLIMLKAPIEKLKDIAGRSRSNSPASQPSTSPPSERHHPRFPRWNRPDTKDIKDKDGEGPVHRDSGGRKRAKSESNARRKRQSWRHIDSVREKDEEFLKNGPSELISLFKPLSMNMSKRRENQGKRHSGRCQFEELDFDSMIDQVITFRARIHTIRRMSAKLAFFVFRQQTVTIQGVLEVSPENDHDNTSGIISEQMIRVVEHYPPESIVLVKGKVRQPPQPVQNATIHKTEILILEIHLVSHLTEHVPFTVYDAENIGKLAKKEDQEEEGESEVEEISAEEISTSSEDRPIKVPTSKPRSTINMNRLMDDLLTTMLESDDDVQRHNRSLPQAYRLSNRVVDLRTASSQAIFRIQSGICNLFRSYLDSQGFIEIHTPKLQGTATESGASVFEANYFGRRAYLAQSPQLAKQMCIAADFERVYEIGAVFRAEDSNTPRHLTEYTGLDLEMALEEHYYEALDLIDEMLKSMWRGLYERYGKEIEIISHFYPHEKVLWLEKTPRLRFSEGIKLLIEDGWTDDEGNPPSDLEDLSTRAEIRLGQIVREKFKTDYYILDKFPVSVRPFYTMPDPENENFTNSFDIFMRGQEIISGGQRIHDAGFLEKKMRKLGIKPESMDDYMEGFRWGAPPHAGAGVGLERLTYLFLNLGNIRLASLIPRDPKSFPRRSTGLELRHPEASTTNPPWEERTLEDEEPASRHYQPLEKLIANYGDAANTSWLDDRYEIWRHPSTGAAQGFVPFHGFAITIGEPLCAKSQYPQVVSAYLEYLQTERRNLKPIWLMIGDAIEEYLGDKYNWRTLSPIAEDRVDPRLNQALRDHDLARKIRHAEHEKVKNFEHAPTEPLPEDLVQRIDARIREWKKGRRGTQVHLTEIMPWVDQAHRRYYYAASGNKDGRIEALVVLHQLAPEHGYQVKFSLEFPGAPSGTIESLNVFAMAAIVAREPEVRSMTYGTAATEDLVGGRNLGRAKVGMLKRSYETINGRLRLRGKREFREKLGAREERVYLAYPRGGLGAAGIKAILDFMQEGKH